MITLTKPKRFFMGAFVGALFTRNTNKTNNKQRVNREYDSESGTTYLETDALRRPFCFIKSISYPHPVVYYCPLKSTGSAPICW
ncbi:hypothetical protein FE839_01540 [Klebsiella indica]|uniref:Uncharacterized protein n=1 Tax=Klebsiella indica TaxID=2582917 RepID=A0A5R9LPG1_9ENTR|nr:hypothetical protein FE839_01540 [Klebsiella indica]